MKKRGPFCEAFSCRQKFYQPTAMHLRQNLLTLNTFFKVRHPRPVLSIYACKIMYIYIYIYIYIQRLCYSWRRFPHPACHAFLFSQSPGHRFLRSISRCIFSLQSRLGLPLFLLLFGTQSNILLGHRSSVILWTCPYDMSLFMLIVSIMSLFLCTLLLISCI